MENLVDPYMQMIMQNCNFTLPSFTLTPPFIPVDRINLIKKHKYLKIQSL